MTVTWRVMEVPLKEARDQERCDRFFELQASSSLATLTPKRVGMREQRCFETAYSTKWAKNFISRGQHLSYRSLLVRRRLV